MSIEDLLRDLVRTFTDPSGTADERLCEEFLRACRRVDDDPREQRRLDDIADLLDTEEALYAQAVDAAARGDKDAAVPLLRQCAEAGVGEAAWLLAQVLEGIGNAAEAMIWYQRALDDGDVRAAEKLAALRAQPCPPASSDGELQEDRAATAGGRTVPVLVVGLGLGGAGYLLSGADRRLDHGLISPAVFAGPTSYIGGLWLITDPGSDHDASFADMWGAVRQDRRPFVVECKECKAQQASVSRARKWALPAGKPEVQAWTPAEVRAVVKLFLCDRCNAVGKSRTPGRRLFDGYYAAGKSRALDWCLARADYDQMCSANLARLIGAGQWDVRRPAREPIVADVMLPPSEVPVCRPDTTLMEALEQVVQSGAQALPVCEMSRIVGVVTLADLARHISDHLGLPPAAETVKALMRPATVVPADTPLSAIAQAIADDGIIAISDSDNRPVGYLTAESVLTQAPAGASGRPTVLDRPPLLIPGAGAVLLNQDR